MAFSTVGLFATGLCLRRVHSSEMHWSCETPEKTQLHLCLEQKGLTVFPSPISSAIMHLIQIHKSS
jgi:hypothetical protein